MLVFVLKSGLVVLPRQAFRRRLFRLRLFGIVAAECALRAVRAHSERRRRYSWSGAPPRSAQAARATLKASRGARREAIGARGGDFSVAWSFCSSARRAARWDGGRPAQLRRRCRGGG